MFMLYDYNDNFVVSLHCIDDLLVSIARDEVAVTTDECDYVRIARIAYNSNFDMTQEECSAIFLADAEDANEVNVFFSESASDDD
jgi:hypothetical protein